MGACNRRRLKEMSPRQPICARFSLLRKNENLTLFGCFACPRAYPGRVPVPTRSPLRTTETQWIYVYIRRGVLMPVARSRTFRSGNGEALRLPKDVAFGEDVELVIVRSGDVLTVYRATTTIPEMAARLRALPAPPAVEARDVEELPARHGL